MVNPNGNNGEASVESAVTAYRDAWHQGGAAALARAWTSGLGKIGGLGPASASKIAYFALYEREAKRGPLIADLNTAWAAWALGGIRDSRYDAEKYADYVDCANAGRLTSSADPTTLSGRSSVGPQD